jgi:PBP1b-binding outer membrane lipoprotein LpoB
MVLIPPSKDKEGFAKAEGVVERKSEEKTAEREAEKAEVQRKLSDSRIAIEIGRLAAADVISIGALYKVRSKHYLTIKLISVKTGEIMASSVATAETEDDYFNMCNEAVRVMLR